MKYVRMMLFCFIACVFLVSVAGAQDTIKIGLLAPLTGPAAADGLSVQNSVEVGGESECRGRCWAKRLNSLPTTTVQMPKMRWRLPASLSSRTRSLQW